MENKGISDARFNGKNRVEGSCILKPLLSTPFLQTPAGDLQPVSRKILFRRRLEKVWFRKSGT